jgi:hypothetical protein
LNVTQFGDDIPGFQELIDLQENQIQKTKFNQLQCSSFWAQLKDKPSPSREAEKKLLPLTTTYHGEAGFSSLLVIRTKARNNPDPQHDLRCALAISVKPRFDKLLKKLKQHHGSY